VTLPDAGTHADRLERTVGRVLMLGITASSLCLGAGLVLTLIGVKAEFTSLLLTLGLLMLLATPASRVVVSAVVYARSRDWLFVALTVIVLLELALSVIAAMH
jgi:uncharacterized membrane protein